MLWLPGCSGEVIDMNPFVYLFIAASLFTTPRPRGCKTFDAREYNISFLAFIFHQVLGVKRTPWNLSHVGLSVYLDISLSIVQSALHTTAPEMKWLRRDRNSALGQISQLHRIGA